jgi:MraZ protein
LFGGWSIHNLDAKGRLAIPAKFRSILSQQGSKGIFVTTSTKCLVCYPDQEWAILTDKVSKLPLLDKKAQSFRRYFISGATPCTLDKQGRILIPPVLRDMAGLDSQVLVAGMQKTFEIWDKDLFYEERRKIAEEFDDLSTAMAELGI